MKCLRILLPTFLLLALLLCNSSVAYAADGDDSGVDVNVVIAGDDADVEVDVIGNNPEVWINGQNLNEPTVIHKSSGAKKSWVEAQIEETAILLYSQLNEFWGEFGLVANGLAKVIVLAKDNNSGMEAQIILTGEHSSRLDSLESEADNIVISIQEQESLTASQEVRIGDLEAQNEALQAQVTIQEAELDYLESHIDYLSKYYNWQLIRMGSILLGILLVIAVGSGVSIYLTRRTR